MMVVAQVWVIDVRFLIVTWVVILRLNLQEFGLQFLMLFLVQAILSMVGGLLVLRQRMRIFENEVSCGLVTGGKLEELDPCNKFEPWIWTSSSIVQPLNPNYIPHCGDQPAFYSEESSEPKGCSNFKDLKLPDGDDLCDGLNIDDAGLRMLTTKKERYSTNDVARHTTTSNHSNILLALKAFTDQKKRFFPHLDDGLDCATTEPVPKKHLIYQVLLPASKLEELIDCKTLSAVLMRLEKEVPNLKSFTYERLDWLKRASSLPSSANESP
ncbi:hypothetical protein Ddye_008450 [Dipteronia dyeriana]|uniref:Uncharacterized protein n=1 Tax=Dipteronia dyeriana TaxID=168575 RepID=A0AAD9X9T9_9ROSI|nr:hypothetical protein Ddye_008450 [Dipteronia dyeriana]